MSAPGWKSELINKRILITGAAGGIGATLATELTNVGARLLLVDINAEGLARTAEPLEQDWLSADLLDADSRSALHDHVEREWGALDGLVNCAGINAFGLQDAFSDQQLERVIAINLVAPMLLTRRFLGLLGQGTAPVIVNLGSVFAHIGFPGFSGYSASKFGLHGYSEALRRELSDGPVRVAWISPRATRTAMNAGAVDEMNAELKIKYDEPANVAQAICAELARPGRDRVLGFPEKLFARINQVFPAVVDRSLRAQLPVIRKYSQSIKEQNT